MTSEVARLFVDCHCARLDEIQEGKEPFGFIADAAIVVAGGSIRWAGPRRDLPPHWAGIARTSLGGGLITPGLVNCHGLLFQDVPDLAAALGGWMARGFTSVEIRCACGDNIEENLRNLRIIAKSVDTAPIGARITLLVGSEAASEIESICTMLIPTAHSEGLIDLVEVCCDEGAGLSLDDSSTILETAYRRKIATRLQVDITCDSGGAALAPSFYAKAASDLFHTDEMGIEAMATAGTVAVLVRDGDKPPPVGHMRAHRVPMAIAPDLARHGICLYGLTEAECLHGLTRIAAKALGLVDGTGTLTADAPGDFALWTCAHPWELLQGAGSPKRVWRSGKEVLTR